MNHKQRTAVMIPCWNEALSIGQVVSDFKAVLPEADIYVFDNNSTDQTVLNAKNAGALVFSVPLQGKGHVVRRMFADIDADIYVLVDGDGTYDSATSRQMIKILCDENLDMVVGRRVANTAESYRPGHRLGNRLLTKFVAYLFGNVCQDMLSGYRIFSRRFVKSFPASSRGFEIETELTIHALDLRMGIKELDTPYAVRMPGSLSKLRTYQDGLMILLTIVKLFRNLRPKNFYGLIGILFSAAALTLAIPLLITYVEYGVVPRFPTAILVSGMMVIACLCFVCGLILNAVSSSRRELKYLTYLNVR
jgi:glycosyltransferase involved in cell wall biosynthesis